MFLTFFDHKLGGTKSTSEEFNTAGRAIKTGLVAVDVVSRSTWVAALVLGANVAYIYGISGAFWFVAAAVIQLFLFGILALELKHKAPKAHTVIELVDLRWGKFASFVFLYLCYLNNFCVSALMFIGAGNVLTATTGMNVYASLVLLPTGVVIYTCSGGLKATYTSSYIHTVIIFMAVNLFLYTVYASNKEPIGSITKVWDNLNLLSSVVPVKDNRAGSYMTMFSKSGFLFGLFNLVQSFGVLFADQAYWQGAIAAAPKAAFRGYILGGLLFFPIPFGLAMSTGLSALALDLPISPNESNQGLIPVAIAQYLMGKGGVFLVLTIIFMAVTSSGSAECMSMSSLWTYDVYKRYINPKATSKQLLAVSRASVVIFGMLMAAVACVLKAAGIDTNFIFFVVGLLVSSAFPPLLLMIIWQAVPAGAAIAAGLGGQVLSIAVWLAHTQILYGRMTVSDTLQRLSPTLDGTLVSVVSSTLICVIWTLLAPEKEDTFKRWLDIEMEDDVKVPDTQQDDLKQKHVIFNKYSMFVIVLTAVVLILWPVLTLPASVFSKGYFTFWIALTMIWTTVASAVATFLPLIESRTYLLIIVKRALGLGAGNPGSTAMASDALSVACTGH